LGFVATEVAFEQLAFGAREIHDDQAIEDVGEFRVDVKSQELSAKAEVLPQEDRDTCMVGFNFGDQVGEFVEIAAGGKGGRLGRTMTGTNKMRPLFELRRAFEEGHHQLP
jgi:hypothetical protein